MPKISVLMPVYNPPLKFFEMALASVRNQIYENWELCIADDASTEPWVRTRLRELANEDPRIRVCFRERNGNISLASNSAAAIATGDFFLFLDQDDLLTHDALAEVALHLSEHDTIDVLYSDDDKIDTEGNRFAPQFKPDWSPELLLSYMYLSHLLVVRKALFEQVNGFRPGFEGSQDYDLALRVTERARSVAHLPYILYHWRVLRGSTAARGDAKPASFEAGRRAVAEALARRGVEAKVIRPDWAVKGAVGIFWHEFPDDGPSVSIVIPTRNQKRILERCIKSLAITTYRNYEVVVIDNDSDDPETLSYLASLKYRVLKIHNPMGEFNFAYINNRAVEQVDSDYIVFLNNDTEVRDPKWLSRMVGYAGLPGVGAVGARLLYPDGRIQHAGIIHGYYDAMAGPALKLLPDWHHGYLSYGMVARNYSAVTAACLLTPRQLFLEHGGFDERRFGVAYNDVDYCYRLVDNGYRCVYVPGAELYHHEGFSRGFKDDPKEVAAFRRKYSNRIDPYYSPNLSLQNERFEIQPRRLVRIGRRKPIRALMCSNNLNLEGAPYCQYELAIELARRNEVKPVVHSPTEGPLRAIYERAGIEVIVGRHPLHEVFELPEYNRAIDDFSGWMKRSGFQLIYGNTLQTFYAIDAATRGGLPSLWNIRESEPWQTYFNYLLSPLIPKALACFGLPYRVIFVSHASRCTFEPLNASGNFCVIHDGLDTRRLDETRAGWPREKARNTLHLNENEVMVLLLGTICDRKGQKDLVQAMTLLEDNVIKKVRLFIVGDRPSLYSSEMRKMVSALPKHRAAKISIIPETRDTATYYSAADIFVCSSRIESYPRVILEAMAYGLPIISTPIFGILEQIRDGINGDFYKPGDEAELASKLSELVLDREKREKYQINARQVLESLTSFDEMINSYTEVFRESITV
ncbi:MAG TPA: glycosyltransferase [Pyrinomonadaceae bacterium]|nr:glycosyltransferase [Pyrinomonadaceae bacterium]